MPSLSYKAANGSGMKQYLMEVWGSITSLPLDLPNLPFGWAKVVVQCTSAWQLTWPRTIGYLLILNTKKEREKRGHMSEGLCSGAG